MDDRTCDTSGVAEYKPSEELVAARAAMDDAKATADAMVKAATDRFHNAIAADAAVETNNIVDIAAWLNFTSTYVSRIARAKGVKPRVDVEPPRRRKSTPDPEADHGGPPPA